jgi:hypothetical protein
LCALRLGGGEVKFDGEGVPVLREDGGAGGGGVVTVEAGGPVVEEAVGGDFEFGGGC